MSEIDSSLLEALASLVGATPTTTDATVEASEPTSGEGSVGGAPDADDEAKQRAEAFARELRRCEMIVNGESPTVA